MRFPVLLLLALLAAGAWSCGEDTPAPIPANCDVIPSGFDFGDILAPADAQEPITLTAEFHILNRVFINSQVRKNDDLRGEVSLSIDDALPHPPRLRLDPADADPRFRVAPRDSTAYTLALTVENATSAGVYRGLADLGGECAGFPFRITVTQRTGALPVFHRAWGRGGEDPGEFSYPLNLAEDPNGNIYVVDRQNPRVQRFDDGRNVNATYTRLFTEIGELVEETDFRIPRGIVVDHEGNIHLGDSGRGRIYMFNSAGVHLKSWGFLKSGPFFTDPWALAVDDEDHVYVLDPQGHHVQKFRVKDHLTQELLADWGPPAGAPGRLGYAWDLAVHGDAVYITDYDFHLVHKFTTDGQYLKSWGGLGEEHRQFTNPTGIAVDAGGNVYVADSGNARIQKFDAEGNFLNMWGMPGNAAGRFREPNDLLIDRHGVLLVVDSGNKRIQEFTLP